ncbi:MAG: universal stress protein [Salinarimonas sp.]|nr:universal stress protein [Salinarimonas sp.]
MTQPILVATDLSARSDVAIARAYALAARRQAKLIILHVVDDDEPTGLVEAQIRSVERFLEETLQSLRAGSDAAARVEAEIIVERGDSFRVINDTAENSGASLIVMGAHRKNIFLDVFRGTTIERVLHTGKTPLLLANRTDGEGIESVVLGVEPDEHCARAISQAEALGFLDGAVLTAVRAYPDFAKLQMTYAGVDQDEIRRTSSEESQKQASEIYGFLAGTALADRDYRLILEEGAPGQLLVKLAGDLDADLIVVGTRSLEGLRKVMLGSVTENVLRQARCDVLAVPPRD